MAESEIKSHLCKLVGNPFAQKDWGGEACDIFCNLTFRRRSVPAAFVLKGKAYAHRPLRIADLGKNGDQLVRMFSLQASVCSAEQWSGGRDGLQPHSGAGCRKVDDSTARVLLDHGRRANGSSVESLRNCVTPLLL